MPLVSNIVKPDQLTAENLAVWIYQELPRMDHGGHYLHWTSLREEEQIERSLCAAEMIDSMVKKGCLEGPPRGYSVKDPGLLNAAFMAQAYFVGGTKHLGFMQPSIAAARWNAQTLEDRTHQIDLMQHVLDRMLLMGVIA